MQECAESIACPRLRTAHPRLALVAELVSTIYHSLALTQTRGRHRLSSLFNDEGMRLQSIKAASKQRRGVRTCLEARPRPKEEPLAIRKPTALFWGGGG
ncbi:hypothetical protein AB1Y20_016574 [Prymnesium parvum]|uniref:Uncharacterized protein n=1 Tax=Prymnesium parvum TaxID=97485 RepID=A0AB34ID51_PRYPA